MLHANAVSVPWCQQAIDAQAVISTVPAVGELDAVQALAATLHAELNQFPRLPVVSGEYPDRDGTYIDKSDLLARMSRLATIVVTRMVDVNGADPTQEVSSMSISSCTPHPPPRSLPSKPVSSCEESE